MALLSIVQDKVHINTYVCTETSRETNIEWSGYKIFNRLIDDSFFLLEICKTDIRRCF